MYHVACLLCCHNLTSTSGSGVVRHVFGMVQERGKMGFHRIGFYPDRQYHDDVIIEDGGHSKFSHNRK